jgi:hypothetical protein
MSTQTQAANTLFTRCPRVIEKRRAKGFLMGQYAVLSCPESDGVRNAVVFATAVERDALVLKWRRKGCNCQCTCMGSHPVLNFDHR